MHELLCDVLRIYDVPTKLQQTNLTVPKNMQLIGITGKAQSGKTTAAEQLRCVLKDITKAQVNVYEMATDVKFVCHSLYGLPMVYFSARELKDNLYSPLGLSPRQLMQFTGDLFRALFGEDYWLKLLLNRIKRFEHCGKEICIITGLRYQNEVDFIASNNGKLIRLTYEPDTGIVGTQGSKSELELDFTKSLYIRGENYHELDRQPIIAYLYYELQNLSIHL